MFEQKKKADAKYNEKLQGMIEKELSISGQIKEKADKIDELSTEEHAKRSEKKKTESEIKQLKKEIEQAE